MDDVIFAHNVPAYIALKLTPKVVAPGEESVVYNCLVRLSLLLLFEVLGLVFTPRDAMLARVY